jgi:hypothetical protein
VNEHGSLTKRQWEMFRSRMEELANPGADAIGSPVVDSYLAEVVLILMDRIDDLEQQLSRSVSPLSAVVRSRLDALTQEDWDAFLANYRQYVVDGWGEFRAMRSALGTLLLQLEQRERQARGKEKRA